MANKQLTVIVIGEIASGKTTVARLITEALSAHGINAANLDPDVQLRTRTDLQPMRLEALAGDLEVAVHVVQVRKRPDVAVQKFDVLPEGARVEYVPQGEVTFPGFKAADLCVHTDYRDGTVWCEWTGDDGETMGNSFRRCDLRLISK